jgi:hypothetical protein
MLIGTGFIAYIRMSRIFCLQPSLKAEF